MLWCFILLYFLSVVCCWSSSHFPTLLWVLCLRGSSVFSHDRCCFDPDDWTLFPSLDTNLQLNLSLCVCFSTNQFSTPFSNKVCAILLFAFSQVSIESLDFLPCWRASAESVIHLEYHLRRWLPRLQQDTLPKSKLCAECKYKVLLVVPHLLWRSFGKFSKSKTVLFFLYSWRMRVPRNAIMMAWLRKKCPTDGCSLICKGWPKTLVSLWMKVDTQPLNRGVLTIRQCHILYCLRLERKPEGINIFKK